ncbi:4-phosphoerythronate dehydrogenase PdxB [Pseudomonas sp. HR96]|uniref:4-phosphoerythronate dehydrogenase PdxB n=1 Tax=Pseudomonas sp. HR96 TaxID=1027966 RepID=UPI002A754487|nr:4-phosphoerythronate dehydrogenase PdxB [Pseudomonas sp. HR96]WPP01446.1 4-phosphoerythronate dehydrogenase PdxB [Pseudomonas sp. HR96]
MLIVADENIPLCEAFFGGFGEIRRVPGRTLTRDSIGDAQVLLVRSVTRVDRALLEGSQVRFVGTCTIGTDHLDLAWLAEAGIEWASAPGCNARGVVDYVLGSLLTLADLDGAELAARTYGVVGAGQVGGRLIKVLRGLGWTVKVCDPLRQAEEGGDYVSLDEVIDSCDVISLHTPLARGGEHPTWHLFDAPQLARLRHGAWLINAARGAVIDNLALRELLTARDDVQAVLDVWEHEPGVDPALADLCVLATPHIAGYSLDGRQRGTEQIYRALCQFLQQAPSIELVSLLSAAWLSELRLHASADPAWALAAVCRSVYDPRSDDNRFRRTLGLDAAGQRAAFDALRKNYPPRREIDGLAVSIAGDCEVLRGMVEALGCRRV